MPYLRPTLTELRSTVSADIASGMPDGQALLRHANVRVMGVAQAGLASLHYGYLDWISKQSVPWASTGEYLVAWGALKNTYLKPATESSGSVAFTAAQGSILDVGTTFISPNGYQYVTTASAVASSSNVVTAPARALTPGADGNCDAGVVMMLQVAIPGIESRGSSETAFTGGADTEKSEPFRARVMAAYQKPPRGGADHDYEKWALDVSGITRAWCLRNGFGAGTVVVYVMLDITQANNGGFPVGADGVAAAEDRPAAKASGDQSRVASVIFEEQPVTALVYVCSPKRNRLVLTVKDLASASQATRAAIASAVSGILSLSGSPLGSTVNRTDLVTAISAVPQTSGFVLSAVIGDQDGVETVYEGNITSDVGYLPTLEAINYPE